MATRALLLLFAILSSASCALCYQDFHFDNERDPEQRLQQCRRQCEQQQRGQQQRTQCERRCEEQYQREQQERHESTGRGGGGGNSRDPEQRLQQCRQQCQQQSHGQLQRMQCERHCEQQHHQQERREQGESVEGKWDPERKKYEECKQRCGRQRQDEQQRQQCVSRCETQYEEERREHGRQGNSHHRQEEQEQGEQSEENNPFRFGRQSFRDVVRSEHGRVSVLQNFLDKSKLFLGIANYRITIVEANPHAFFTPRHLDADAIYFVARGWGSITHISQDMKETHNIQRGDILAVPAGCIVYLVNKDNNEKLVLIKLMNPVSTPGHYEIFHGAGGRHESILPSFSDEILEAAFNIRRGRLERVFGRQKGHIVKASEEQVRSLSRHTTEGGRQWPFGESQYWGTFNLLKKRPTHSSRRGQLHEADGNDYAPLKRFDIQVSYANLSQGSMIAPVYNTRAFKIAVILQGEGYIETVCPHMWWKKHWQRREQGGEQEQEREEERRRHSWEEGREREREQEQEQRRGKGGEEEEEEEEEEQGRRQGYQNVRSQATAGTVVLIPPGHPTVAVASGSRNLEAVCFEINAERNERNFLAGRNNVLSKIDKEAKELAFGIPAREVDEVLQEQKEEMIVAGPEEREHGRRPLLPLLDIAAAFM